MNTRPSGLESRLLGGLPVIYVGMHQPCIDFALYRELALQDPTPTLLGGTSVPILTRRTTIPGATTHREVSLMVAGEGVVYMLGHQKLKDSIT